ncbi:MAG: DUF6662 family protein [Bdellovibrionales bacterium]
MSFVLIGFPAGADENLLGYVKGAEPLPAGGVELYQVVTSRKGKAAGRYHAIDTETEVEYGVTNRFSVMGSLFAQSIDTSGLVINGYLPKDHSGGLELAGVEAGMKYNFLSAVTNPIGLSAQIGFDYRWLDPHSGQDKDTFATEILFIFQKYLLDAQLILTANLGLESTHATRGKLSDLPDEDFDWPTKPEMEIEPKAGFGVAYRFVPNWFAGAEAIYETEYETDIGQERWSWFAGPSLHYSHRAWWATLTWLPQIAGGGEEYDGQTRRDLHLIEKTEQEVRLKVGLNF